MRHLALLTIALGAGCSEHFEAPEESLRGAEQAGDTASAGAGSAGLAPATLHRLTDAQWRASVASLTGIDYTGTLPGDYDLYGFAAVGASEISVAPLDLEQYEAAAWDVALAALPDRAAREAWLGCDAGGGGLGTEDLGLNEDCLRAGTLSFLERAWRRPVSEGELQALLDMHEAVAAEVGEELAAQSLMAATLLSPHFLYRVEIGESDPADPGRRRFTDYELAARLSYLLTGTTPDDTLLAAAARGELTEPEDIERHARRLLAAPAARRALVDFFAEYMDLDELDSVDKSAELFPELTDTLRASMAQEVRWLFEELALKRAADFRSILTTNETWVDTELAALYSVPAPAGGRAAVPARLPQQRGGLLGRAAFLTINAHATLNSPTLRGKFVRSRLLCQDIPAPPAGVSTSLEDHETDGTLRDLLEGHMSDPTCAGCHQLMDPIGFGLEHFDPIGRYRLYDNGFPVDASGDLDGIPFDGAAQLGRLLAEDDTVLDCVTRHLFRHAAGHLELEGEDPAIEGVVERFADSGGRFVEMVVALVTSEAFRTAAHPAGEACTEEGATRGCAAACGEGVEVCQGGTWGSCDAPLPRAESCDGVDSDCDGATDEGVLRSCSADGLAGYQACTDASWDTCETAGPGEESCDGADNDADGAVDEELEVSIEVLSFEELSAIHSSCDPTTDGASDACYAATSRYCAATGCAVSGFPAAAMDLAAEREAVTCLSGDKALVFGVSYGELAARHEGCTSADPIGPSCNAAINRWCAEQGYGTGFGPVEHSGEDAAIVCTPSAAIVETYYSTLDDYVSSCNGDTERSGDRCGEAFHRFCRDRGYASGFGPLENSGDLAYAACLGAL